MKTVNLLVALTAFVIGVVLGSGGMQQLTEDEAAQLRQTIKGHEARIDSLRILSEQLTDSLRAANKVTTVEILRYEKIKPKSYSVPAIDSFLRARYR